MVSNPTKRPSLFSPLAKSQHPPSPLHTSSGKNVTSSFLKPKPFLTSSLTLHYYYLCLHLLLCQSNTPIALFSSGIFPPAIIPCLPSPPPSRTSQLTHHPTSPSVQILLLAPMTLPRTHQAQELGDSARPPLFCVMCPRTGCNPLTSGSSEAPKPPRRSGLRALMALQPLSPAHSMPAHVHAYERLTLLLFFSNYINYHF